MEISRISERALLRCVEVLKRGGVVVCPTDTVYGFLADAGNKKAVAKIYKIKKRSKSKPLPVFVKDFEMAKEIAEISKDQEKIIKKKWPGKYTFVLKRKKGKKLYGVDKNTIALRIPKHVFLQKVLKEIHRPLVQTSVNISTQSLLHAGKDIIAVFGKSRLIGLIIDGGTIKKGKSSKVIDVTSKNSNILRP